MDKAMKSFPVMFCRWRMKHMYGCCSCNKDLSLCMPGLIDLCPVCDTPYETTAHITICTDTERIKLYKDVVDSLVGWMEKNDTAPLLSMMIEDNFCARGSRLMADVAPPPLGVNCRILCKVA